MDREPAGPGNSVLADQNRPAFVVAWGFHAGHSSRGFPGAALVRQGFAGNLHPSSPLQVAFPGESPRLGGFRRAHCPVKTVKLSFYYRGDRYLIDPAGRIMANGLPTHSPDWIFLGGSRHHASRRIDVSLADAFREPSRLNGCLGWDRDHGTLRQWRSGGKGFLARISGCAVIH